MNKILISLLATFTLLLTACGNGDKDLLDSSSSLEEHATALIVAPTTVTTVVDSILQMQAYAILNSNKVIDVTSHSAVSWQSSDPAIASVDEVGLLTAHSEGVVTITAIGTNTDETKVQNSATVTVTAQDSGNNGSSLQLAPIVSVMTVGDTTTLDVTEFVNAEEDWTLTEVSNDSSGVAEVTKVSSPTVTINALTSGIAELSYNISTASESQTGVLLVLVNRAENTPPTAQNLTVTTDSDTALLLDLTKSISDSDGDTVTITRLLQSADPARFTLQADNQVVYTPQSYIGVDYATYVVEDSRSGYNVGQIIVNVTDANPVSPNTPPTAEDYIQATTSDTPVSLDLAKLGLIEDKDGDTLTLSLYSDDGRAIVSGTTVTYSPDGFIGTDEVVYVVSDGQGGNAIASLLFVVSDANAGNTPPQAQSVSMDLTLQDVKALPESDDDEFEGKMIVIDLDSYVSDDDGDDIAVVLGAASENPVAVTGKLQLAYYIVNPTIHDHIAYVITDSKGGLAFADIELNLVNTAPTAQAVALMIDPFDSSTPSLVIDMNDYTNDLDGDALTISLLSEVVAPATLTQDGMLLTYTPNGVERTESIGYVVTDGNKNAANVISITSGSQGALTANDITLTNIDMDAPVQTIDVSSYVNNASGRDMVLEQVVGATLGTTAILDNSLSFTYTPNDISYGLDKFFYRITDNEGHYAWASVSITLNESAKPEITALDLVYENGGVRAVMTCTDCDDNLTEYQFEVNSVPVGTNSDYYTLVGDEIRGNIGVVVTTKNRYCTAENIGINDGNACKITQAKMVVELSVVKTIYSANQSFAALKTDGSVVTWGNSNHGGNSSAVQGQLVDVEKIFSTGSAFAALKPDGTVVTWGDSDNGGDSSAVQSELTNVQTIFSNDNAFAALKADGTVVTWGNASYGANSSGVQDQLTNVKTIFSGPLAFAALKHDGTVVTWGQYNGGGDSSAVQDQLTNVETIVATTYYSATYGAFAALKTDGSVVTWGYGKYGGTSSAVQSQLTAVTAIFSTSTSFAALKADGSVVTWGSYSGDSSAVQSQLTNVETIYSTKYAFAALKSDGTVVTWGRSSFGGDSNEVQDQLTDVEMISVASGTFEAAFAALKADGTVVVWGANFKNAGDSSAVQDQLIDVETIFSTTGAFAALKTDDTVVYWGGFGSYVTRPSGDISNVDTIFSNDNAFAALKNDGFVETWGYTGYGGGSSSVQSQLTPTVNEIFKDLAVK
ncbi:Ig-like domain-containing protein [Vibrio parahaemolyticus]